MALEQVFGTGRVMRVFVGCDGNGTDAESCAVLEHSIRKYASEPVEFVWMRLSRDPSSFYYSDGDKGWQTERWATPFSALRWSPPAYCNYEGRSIYVDSDFIVMSDLAELWHQPMNGKAVLGKAGSWRLCMALWDNAEAKKHLWPIEDLRSDPFAHKEMSAVFRRPNVVGAFQGNWNVLDCEDFADVRDPSIKAHHYTRIDVQLHHRHAAKRLADSGVTHWFDGRIGQHPRADFQALFDELLIEASAAGFSPERYVPDPLFGDYKKASLKHYGRR